MKCCLILRAANRRGLKEGLQQAKDKWLAEGKAEVTKAMLLGGMPVDQIMQFTGLSEVQIEALR